MPLDAPITISQQSRNLQAVLGDWAVQNGGQAEVVSDLKNFWMQAGVNNDIPRILIVYMGEDARGDFRSRSALDRVDRRWTVGVFRGRGFSARRGDSLTTTVVNAVPFYNVVESVRDLIRSILNISEEFPVEFMSIKPAPNYGNMVMDGYLIEFVTANDIPAILLDKPIIPDPSPESDNPPEVPRLLAIQWLDPINYQLEWTVDRAPNLEFRMFFSNVSGGPYVEKTTPPASGMINYLWETNGNIPETPPSLDHEDMYLIVRFDDGDGIYADSPEYHGVWAPS